MSSSSASKPLYDLHTYKEPPCGEVIFAGASSWSLSGRSGITKAWDGVEERNLMSFHRLKPLVNIPVHTIIVGSVANHSFVLTKDGGIYGWGRNDNGELGLGDTENRYNPTPITKLNNSADPVIGGACGDKHSLWFTRNGALYTSGSNEFGQLGTGQSGSNNVNPSLVSTIEGVRTAGAGRSFSCVANKAGKVYSWGYPKDGVLGHGTEGKFLGTGNRWEYSLEVRPRVIEELVAETIAEVACGAAHTIVTNIEGKVWTWGFGGYGRLGHGDNKNQFSPKKLEHFHNVPEPKPAGTNTIFFRPQKPRRLKYIAAGSRCCWGIDVHERAHFWGITKSSGEATMYPKIFEGLNGWRVREISCGVSSSICASEYSLITWGPSPTFGELGYGEGDVKSSTVTKKVDDLEDTNVLKVGMGFQHSLAIIDPEDGGRKVYEKLKVFDPPELKDIPGRDKIIAAALDARASSSKNKNSKNSRNKNRIKSKGSKRKRSNDDDDDDDDGTEDDDDEDASEEEKELDLRSLTVPQLKNMLRKAGLKVSGARWILVGRLKKHMEKQKK